MNLGIAIVGGTLQERYQLRRNIDKLIKRIIPTCDFMDSPIEVTRTLTGLPFDAIIDPEISNSYMESQWDYIRDERHTDTEGNITRKPVRYRLSPGRVLGKVIESGRTIHANAWINAADVGISRLEKFICLFEYPNEYAYLSEKKDTELVRFVLDDKARSFVGSLKFTKTFTSEAELISYIKTKYDV